MNKQQIETSITRDLSLIDIYAWHKGYTDGMKKWLGWSYSDSIFYVHNGYTEIMRPPSEHLIDFRDKIIEKIDSDKKWFYKKSDEFDILIKEILEYYEKSKKQIDNIPVEKLSEIYKKYVDYINQSMTPFIVMFWFPIWLENDDVRKIKYKDEIDVATMYRKKTEPLFPGGAELTNNILKRISKETRIDDSVIKVLSPEELFNYCNYGELPNINILKKRLVGFIYARKGIMLTDNSSEDLKKIINKLGYEFVEKKHEVVKEIKGQSACKGKVQGKVRIIMSKKDIPKLEVGEILVTAMTTPEYLPAMHKSVAFITDEGGITCHAAIVARELRKPCIIGTKNATKVLKDGDLVEVDADKGLIKIIN